MKSFTRLVLTAALLLTAVATQASSVRGYARSNGTTRSSYVYRNPYAAAPSVGVRGYTPSSGTYVAPYVRTAPNHTVTDNLSYRGYGTVRALRY